jgi:hypothetical protein
MTEFSRSRKVVITVCNHQCFGQIHPVIIILTCLLDRNRTWVAGNTDNNGRKDTESEGVCHEEVNAEAKRAVQCL